MKSSPPLITALVICGSLLPAASLHARGLSPVDGDRAVFQISEAVVQKSPPRFGANIDPPAMSHWNTEPWHNQWWSGPNINPMSARMKGTASGGGVDFLEANEGWRLGFFDVFRDGFFDGGKVRVYRMTDGKMSLVRTGTIKSFHAAKDGENKLVFTEPGPAVQEGDEFFLATERLNVPRGSTRTWDENPWWLASSFQLAPKSEKRLYEAGVRLALSKDAPPGGGGASLELTVPPGLAETVCVGNWFLDGQEADWPRLRPGTYTVRLWLKQEGLPSGEVEVRVASLKTEKFTVGPEWKEYTFDFEAAPPKGASERFEIGTSEAGKLFIDNVSIVEKDGPPAYGFYPEIVETLRRFQPSTLRLWVLQENKGFGKGLDDALGLPTDSNLTFAERGGARTTVPTGLHQQLELCAQAGTNPWIIVSMMFSEEECRNLIEYLAGPADSPYGKKRAALGRAAPWTETFTEIKIEPGNEVWNPAFAPQQFSGRPAVYGAYSELMFQAMKSSPYYKNGNFQLIVNGWVAQPEEKGFGAVALRNAPSADAFDIAYYTGGWDAVGLMKSESLEESWMNILTYSRRMLLPRSLKAKAAADKIAQERGRPAEVLVYEAGPGYTLPAPGKFNLEEQREGKSLAQAINALDIFMMNLRAGFGDQSFFIFKNGHYWASHNRQWGEHIAWKALGMRNALLKGDLITAEPVEMVTMDLPETQADVVSQTNSANRKVKSFPPVPDMPMVDCYPFKDGDRYSYMLISRRLQGSTPVTLELPYDPDASYTVHQLSADSPAAHNIDGEVVKVVTTEHTGMTKDFTITLPPHSVTVLVNHARK